MPPRFRICFAFCILASLRFVQIVAAAAGDDLIPVFERAQHGAPLRYVAIGGSITQAGAGWIGDWLCQQFPKSAVTVVNSGMSATGSELGVFRAERDIIAHQPDLVALEFCVNDSNLPDDEAIRDMETLIVRLKSLRHPPAIVILEAAAQLGVNLKRHRLVAQHYGLLEVDLQAAVDAHFKAAPGDWTTLFTDSVHPNPAGHALYAQTIEDRLEPFLEKARSNPAVKRAPLPTPISKKPLLLDARMVSLSGYTGWAREASPSQWWGFFFNGTLSGTAPGDSFILPFRGTMAGVFYAMDKSYGSFYVNVDGATPRQIRTNGRGGYYYAIAGRDLPLGEHRMAIALPNAAASPSAFPENGPVKLGYALLAGDTRPGDAIAPDGEFTPDVLRKLQFEPLVANKWSVSTPVSSDTGAALEALYAPESESLGPSHALLTPDALVDLSKEQSAVSYVRTQVDGGPGGPAVLRITVDFFAKVWLNKKLVATIRDHDGPDNPILIPVTLQAGPNDLLMTIVAGSKGHSFSFSIAKQYHEN